MYLIPEENFPKFKARFGALVKRAEKMGVPAPVFQVANTVERRDDDGLRVTVVHEVDVTGEAPVYDGWRFVALVDIDRDEAPDGPHVVSTVPGTDTDGDWRWLADHCEHCNLGRRGRKKLVVVEHDDGTRKVVGSTCLQDFLGHASPQGIAAWAEIVATLDELFHDFEEGGFGGGGEPRFDPVALLAVAAAAIREYGWLPRSRADEGFPTADAVKNFLAGDEKNFPELRCPTENDHAVAAATIAWLAELDFTGNDYLDNLATLAQKGTWRPRDVGLGVSAIPAFKRATEGATGAAESKSEHVGLPGEKVEVDGTVVFTMDTTGHYGVTRLVKIEDRDGNLFLWWNSGKVVKSGVELVEGVRVVGKATVKRHDTYKGVPQTVVTRFSWKPVE